MFAKSPYSASIFFPPRCREPRSSYSLQNRVTAVVAPLSNNERSVISIHLVTNRPVSTIDNHHRLLTSAGRTALFFALIVFSQYILKLRSRSRRRRNVCVSLTAGDTAAPPSAFWAHRWCAILLSDSGAVDSSTSNASVLRTTH